MEENINQKDSLEKKEKVKRQTGPKYELDKLRENCQALFNVSVSTFDGAAVGLTGEYSVSEMRAIIKKWKSKEVL